MAEFEPMKLLPSRVDIVSAARFIEEWGDHEIGEFIESNTSKLILEGKRAVANFIAEAGISYTYGNDISVPTEIYMYNAYFAFNKLLKSLGGNVFFDDAIMQSILSFREKDTRLPYDRLSLYASNIMALSSPNYYNAIDLILASTPQELYKPSFDAFRDSWLMFFYNAEVHPHNKFFSAN